MRSFYFALIVIGAATLLFPACYRPDLRDCAVLCDGDGSCPRGARCSNGYCTVKTANCAPRQVAGKCEACISATQQHSRCRGDTVLVCPDWSAEAKWEESETCHDERPTCYLGTCRACRPGTSRCHNGCEEPCNAFGEWAGYRECSLCKNGLVEPILAAGWSFTCALADGRIFCWGDDQYGQLGLEKPSQPLASLLSDDESRPRMYVNLGSGRAAKSLVAGGRHACALLDTGSVKCWGDNSHGQLGQGDTETRGDGPEEMGDNLRTVDLGRHTAVALTAGGQHTCALLEGGGVTCWGAGASGQLGLVEEGDRGDGPCEMGLDLLPVDLGGARARALAAGFEHTCALLEDGSVSCWGAKALGQLNWLSDDADPLNRRHLTRLEDRPFVGLSLGQSHTCANDSGGSALCWGSNRAGQLGVDSVKAPSNSSLALNPFVHLSERVQAVTAGQSHTCALLEAGEVKCWGLNSFGQLGLGKTGNQGDELGEMAALTAVDLGTSDAAVNLRSEARSVVAGSDHTCAVLSGNRIKCWGRNDRGQLGFDDRRNRGLAASDLGDNLPEVVWP